MALWLFYCCLTREELGCEARCFPECWGTWRRPAAAPTILNPPGGQKQRPQSRKDPVLSYQEGELWPHRPSSAHGFHPNTLSPSQAVLACALAPIPIPACSSEGLWGTFSWSQHRSWAWSMLGDPFPQLSTKHWSCGPLCACGVLGEIFVKSWWKFLTLVSLTLNGMCLEQ